MAPVEVMPNHEFVLRRITADDWRIFRAIRMKALADAPYAFGSTLAGWTGAGDQEERWRQRLTTVPLNIVAFLHDNDVGMVSGTAVNENGTVELISMWVAPAARGSGVADALVNAIVDWARLQAALRVTADVIDGNERAARLYSRHGFVPGCAVTCGDSESRPAFRMVRELSNQ